MGCMVGRCCATVVVEGGRKDEVATVAGQGWVKGPPTEGKQTEKGAPFFVTTNNSLQ